MTIEELAKRIQNLTPEEALMLMDSMTAAQMKAMALRNEEVEAERERDSRYPACTCGVPVTMAGYFMWGQISCEPGIARKNGVLRGGMIFLGDFDQDCNLLPNQPDIVKADRMLWVHCGKCSEPWRLIENGFELKVGTKW